VSALSLGGASPLSPATKVITWIDRLVPGKALQSHQVLWNPQHTRVLRISNSFHLEVTPLTGAPLWVAPSSSGHKLLLTTTGDVEFMNKSVVVWRIATPYRTVELRLGPTGLLQLWRGAHMVYQQVRHHVTPVTTPVVTVPQKAG
jgi:hypothetical protein